MEQEIWKSIKQSPRYEVSNLGGYRRNLGGGRYKKLGISLSGCYKYYMISFSVNNGPRKDYLHRALAEAFIPNPDPAKYTHVGFHNLDGHDCRLENLFWTTQTDLMQRRKEAERYAKGSTHHMSKLDESRVKEIRARYRQGAGVSELAREYGMDPSSLDSVVKYRTWRHVLD